MKRSSQNSVIVGILSYYDPPMEPLIFVPGYNAMKLERVDLLHGMPA